MANVESSYYGTALSNRGVPLVAQSVAICTQPANVTTTPCSPLATTFTDLTGSTPTGTPGITTTDALGNFHFYVPNGIYTVQIYGPQITSPVVQQDVFVPTSLAINNTFTGVTTFGNIVNLTGGTCTVAGLQASIAAVAVAGGTVNATACTGAISTNITNATGPITIPSNVTVYLGPSTWTCTITTASTPCWWLQGGNGPKLIGAGAGRTQEGADPANNAANGVTNLLCSSCGTTTDMVLVQNNVRNAGTGLFTFLVASSQVSGLWINMGNSGREGFYGVGTDGGIFNDLHIFNAVCTSPPCGAFHLAAGIASDSPTTPQAYYNEVFGIVAQASASNTTGASCFWDARFGEVAYSEGVRDVRCSGNIGTGGGLYGLLIQASNANVVDSADTLEFMDSYFGNPVAGASSYGIRLECPGNWSNGTGGRCFQIAFKSSLIERLFSSATGTGFGCTNGGTSNGAGCGDIQLSNIGFNYANWSVALDNITTNNPIGQVVSLGSRGSQSGGIPSFHATGSLFGANAVAIRDDSTWFPNANSQTGFGMVVIPSVNTATFTGTVVKPILIDIGDGTYSKSSGSFSEIDGIFINGTFGLGQFAGVTVYGIKSAGGNAWQNSDGQIQGFTFGTVTNCAVNSVSPAACGSAAAGAFVVPTMTATYTVNTTVVTAASRIFLQPRTYAGDLPSSPTCVTPAITSEPVVSAIVAGTSFTITFASTTGQTCWNYHIIN